MNTFSVINSLQQTLADKLEKALGYDDYALFLINTGAEANENVLKLASLMVTISLLPLLCLFFCLMHKTIPYKV
ncbi:hypothetical protein Barb7_01246 [Bacteroidales bacterium Barb7]|nr:hypothetical protein Barb7_01246 [Bacteroidales bacterium Barb7]